MKQQPGDTHGKHFVFIGGLHRSGTSLLHEILRSHPEISGFSCTGVPEDEGQHLQKIYPSAIQFGGPGRFGFDRASFMDEEHPLATDHNAEELFDQWSAYWDSSKRWLLEKSPPNLVRTRFLQRLFPRCRFIILLRHPIAVAYATRKWCRSSISTLIEHNLCCYERFLADLPRLHHVYVLRYEEFVLNPNHYIGRIFDWLDVEPFAFPQVVRSDINARYLERWRHDVLGIKGCGIKLTGFFHRFEKRAEVFGYSIKNPDILLSTKVAGLYGETAV